MLGQMQDRQLLVSTLIEHAATFHGRTEIVVRTVEGPTLRTSWAEVRSRAKRVAKALAALDVRPGDRVGTLAWNTHRHLELYYGVSGSGAVLHTVNPRLFQEQIEYIVRHAEDRVLFFDITFAELVARMAPALPKVERFVAMTDRAHMPEVGIPRLFCYEDLLAAQDDRYEWPELDERTASTLCYTSGTTGNPKGVLYSHRATLLHTLKEIAGDAYAISAESCVLFAVPMFHANAWGLPYASAMTGAKVVMPGRNLDGRSLFELIRDEGVTFSVGVPTIWLGLFQHVDEVKADLSALRLQKLGVGGAAPPMGLIARIEKELRATVVHGWGMTELFTIGALNTPLGRNRDLPEERKFALKGKAGRALWGVELRIVDEQDRLLPHDGNAFGRLKARGPWTVREYFRGEGGPVLDAEGFFDTGDVATIDPDGYVQLVDRSKDLVKSGGEWISSIAVENAAVAHPAVREAAVIGVPHPRWSERPLLVVVRKEGAQVTREELLAYLSERMAKWWVPDDVAFVDELPHTATGKLSKRTLREQFKNHRLPEGSNP
jgi:fatty-acyl-CoA synthase